MDIKQHNQEWRNLVELLNTRASVQPDVVGFKYLVDGENEETSLTFSELDRDARSIASQLQSIGAEGERVLLLYPPGLDYIKAFFGCLYAGAVAVPTYPPDVTRIERSLPRFLSILSSSNPIAALTTSPILAMAQFMLNDTPEFNTIQWVTTDTLGADPTLVSGWRMPQIATDSLAFIQFTSGSTAEPKGVMLTHGNLFANLSIICDGFEVDSTRDSAVFWLPFYHDMGLIGGVLATIYCGVLNVLISPLDFLQRPMRWLRAISKYQATISGGPNFAYDLCVRKAKPQDLETLDLSSWTLAFNGAEPVRAGTLSRFAKTFGACGFKHRAFYPCYGLAESTLFVSGIGRQEEPLVKSFQADNLALGIVDEQEIIKDAPEEIHTNVRTLVGCGKTGSNHHVAIIDPETLARVPVIDGSTKSVGEIWVSGPSNAVGYWERPEDSKHIFSAMVKGESERVYMRTGDMGFIHNNQLFIAGRLKDLIIIDGLNHYPQDIELSVENCHPGLRPGCSAAFSVEIHNREKLIVAIEVAKPGKVTELKESQGIDFDPKSIKSLIRSTIALNHDLSVYDVVLLKPGTIPKTSSGKIQRHACKRSYIDELLDIWVGE